MEGEAHRSAGGTEGAHAEVARRSGDNENPPRASLLPSSSSSGAAGVGGAQPRPAPTLSTASLRTVRPTWPWISWRRRRPHLGGARPQVCVGPRPLAHTNARRRRQHLRACRPHGGRAPCPSLEPHGLGPLPRPQRPTGLDERPAGLLHSYRSLLPSCTSVRIASYIFLLPLLSFFRPPTHADRTVRRPSPTTEYSADGILPRPRGDIGFLGIFLTTGAPVLCNGTPMPRSSLQLRLRSRRPEPPAGPTDTCT